MASLQDVAMTQPAPPPVDPGNGLLSETPAQLFTSLIQGPGGQRMALTIRTPSTTLTVMLAKQDADAWARMIKQVADAMSGSGLIVAPNGVVPKGQG